MNKIFKVVWSKVKHCYVVVSEIAKNTISGGARRCRVRKGALAAALVTAFLSSSFAMPNSAWAAAYMGDMGLSYEALIVLSADKDEYGKVKFGIDLYRGDSGSAIKDKTLKDQYGKLIYPNGYVYLEDKDLDALKRLYPAFTVEEDYRYTKVSSVGAETQFTTVLQETIQQTVIQEVISSVEEGSNIIVTPQYDSNNNLTSFVIDAKDTTYEVLTGQKDSSGTTTYTVKSSALDENGNRLQWEIKDTNTVLKNPNSNDESYTALELVKGSDDTGDNLVLTVKDTDGNVVSGSAEIGTYVSEKITNEAGNATYNNTTTIKQQITQNISNISNLTDTVNAGWIAKIDDTEIEITPATTEKPNANVLNFAAAGAATVSLSGNTLTIGAVDTYTTKVEVNQDSETNIINTTYTTNRKNQEGEDITYSGISFVEGTGISLDANGKEITISTTGNAVSNYTWKAKGTSADGETVETTINDNGELTFTGTGAANVSLNGNTVTISAVDTRYMVTAGQNNVDTSTNAVNTWTFNEVDGEGTGTVIVDTDTKVLSGSVVEGEKGSYGINLVTNEKDSEDRKVVVPISGLHDYYTTGVNVEGSSLKFNRNDGGSYSVNLTAGGGKLNAQGKPEDTYVQVSAGNNEVIRLKTGSEVSANDGQTYQKDQVLDDITINGQKYTLGYSWKLGVEGDNGTVGDIVVNSGQTLKFAEGDNVQLDYVTETNTIKISALVKGYSNDLPVPQSKKLMANGSEESSKTATQQLKMIEINGELFAVPNIKAVSTSVEGAPILKAVELNGQVYNLDTNSGAMNSWTAKVGEEELTVAEGDVVTYTSDSNIVLSAESDENGGGSINVSLSNDITLQNTESNGTIDTIEIKGSDSTIKVGAEADKKITINGANGTITAGDSNGTNVSINATTGNIVATTKTGDNVTGQVTIDSANNKVTVGVGGNENAQVVINGANGTITGLTNTTWDGTAVTGRAATEDQLQQAVTTINTNINAAKTEVNGSENIKVTLASGSNGQTIYTVSGTDTIKAGKVDVASDGSITLEHVNAKGEVNGVSTRIEGLHDYVIDEQTQKVTDGEVTLKVTDKYNSKNTYNVKITDVASASKLEKVEDKVDSNTEKITKHEAHINNLYENDKILSQKIDSKINQLGSKVNKVGAGSAALAALHPMDFDPDDKLQFSAGVGHYGGENAAALGAFYRPTEKVMFSVAGTMGNGEDMVNAGVTFALDKPNNVSNSRVAMAREIQDLRQQVAALTILVMQMASRDNAALAGVAMFPDVPENHWAYDYIEGLQKQGIIEGYPDGNFGGDRSMTRYEFAAMLYRALEKGFPVDSRLLNEFNAELGRIRVDRIKGADNDANKVERVRVNNYEDRDDYGSKIVQVKAGA